jgi:dienelactone hydrolase
VILLAPVPGAEPPVQIEAIELTPAVLAAREGRLLRPLQPARFTVSLRNRTDQLQKGVLAAEIVGHLQTVHGLAPQSIELEPRASKTLFFYWSPPGTITYEGMPMGPVRLPPASWGHELRVAWIDPQGHIAPPERFTFAVEGEGMPAGVRKLAQAEALTPLQMFELRYSGYLHNPVLAHSDAPKDLALQLPGGKVTSWAHGEAPSGAPTYLARLTGVTGPITLKINNPQRLARTWLLDPHHPEGPRARRLFHRSDGRSFTFQIPPTGRDAVLILELERAHHVASVPAAEMVARGVRQFGPFHDLLRDRRGQPIRTAAQWAEHRKQLRAAIEQALNLRLAASPGPLEPIVLSEETVPAQVHLNGFAPAHTRRKVSLRLRPGERMNVWLLVPQGIGPFPAVVACHQTVPCGKDEPVGLGGAFTQLNYGPFLVGRGFVVLAADSIGAGERYDAARQSAYDFTEQERDPAWSALGQRLHDHRRAVDYLQSLPFVDPQRIGAIGHSLGGESVTMLTALDERIKVAVVSCGFTLLRSLAKADEVYTLKGSSILPARFRELLRLPVKERQLPFDFDDCMALWAPRPVFFHEVRDELPHWTNAAQIPQAVQALQRVYEFLDAADRLQVHYSAQAHCFPQWVQADAFDWLELGLKGK